MEAGLVDESKLQALADAFEADNPSEADLMNAVKNVLTA